MLPRTRRGRTVAGSALASHPRKQTPVPVRLFRPSLLAAALLLAAACTHDKVDPNVPTRPLSSWVAEEAQLFDDGIDVGAIPPGSGQPERDEANATRIPRRVDTADGIATVKVIGVSSEPLGDRTRYRIELEVDGNPIIGRMPGPRFTITVEPEAPSFATIRANAERIVGRKLVIYLKSYAAAEEGDEPVIHFHLSPASPSVLQGIDTYKTKRQFG